MSLRRPFLFCMFLLAAPAWAQIAPPAEAAPAPSPEQVTVVGQRPGPGLWKVSKGDHVLWIFGTYSPVPRTMEWRAQEVEAILSRSQEFIAPPSARVDIGFFRKLTMLPLTIGIKNNPNGALLKDVLPADVYARWLPFKEKYLKNVDEVNHQRPIFAAERLYRAALDQSGLAKDRFVRERIDQIVKKNKIKVTLTEVGLPIKEPRAMLKEFKKSSVDDTACFSATLARLETDIKELQLRANAWSRGNIADISRVEFADREQACKDAMLSTPALRNSPEVMALESRMTDAWTHAVEKALANNESTFSTLPIRQLLDKNGVLKTLATKGYDVHQPD